MKPAAFVMAIFIEVLLSAGAIAHEAVETSPSNSIESVLGVPDPMKIVLVSSFLIAFLVVLSLAVGKRLKNKDKKIIFALMSIPIVLTTLYLVGVTFLLNSISATNGPVHWHADIEVWACGDKYHFTHSTGLDNKVGEPLMHLHDDDRIHAEGVVVKMEDVELGSFFGAVGGSFHANSLEMPAMQGMKKWSNGDLCNSRPGKLYMFVNGHAENLMEEYVISPYFNIPPGDRIKIVFSEKPLDTINPEFSEAP